MNKLYYGDNLDVMRKFIRDETVDLCFAKPNNYIGTKSARRYRPSLTYGGETIMPTNVIK